MVILKSKKIKEICKKVLEEVSFETDEILSFEKQAKEFIKKLEEKGITARLGGSLAKRTLVKTSKKQDIDIFVVFESEKELEKFEKILKKIKLPGKLKKVHGSRDYFNITCPDFVLEIVPVLKNKNPELANNVTDVSLSHVVYVRGELKKRPELINEIKLSKAFFKAQKIYGAESYIKGFSGYSLEVLTIYYGGFLKLLKNLGSKKVMDPRGHFKNSLEVLREINSSKICSPLILVDPIYRYRNVLAGLGSEGYSKFLESRSRFLRKPSYEFFEKKDLDVLKLKNFSKRYSYLFVELNLSTDRQEGDVAGTKMKKFLDFFESQLKRKGQIIIKKEFDYSGEGKSGKGYLIIKEKKKINVRGPNKKLKDAVVKFKKAKGKKAYLKGRFWYFSEDVLVKKVFEESKKHEKEIGVRASFKVLK